MSSAAPEEFHGFAHEAMNTEFRILIPGREIGGVGDEDAEIAVRHAWEELDRLEDDLSRYRENSDIARINRLPEGGSVRVSIATFDCLALARALTHETAGAFNVAIGPLMDVWRSPRSDFLDDRDGWSEAAARVKWDGVDLDDEEISVRKTKAGVSLDLGAIGKGYALDQMAVILEQAGVSSALLDAGESTLLGMNPPAGRAGWPVGLGEEQVLLHRSASSGSGFQVKGAHIMNPERGRPVKVSGRLVWATAPTAAMADGLSTAFAIMDRSGIEELCGRFKGIGAYFSEDQP